MSERTKTLLLALALALAVTVLYWPTVGYDFVHLDDYDYVLRHPAVKTGLTWEGVKNAFKPQASSYPMPLRWLSLMADTELFGLNPGAFHRTNVILYALTGALLFLLFVRLIKDRWLSFFASAFFLVHPLRVESVAWVTERKDLLAGLTIILALWAYVSYAENGRRRYYAASLGAMILGMTAKPMAATLPVLLVFVDWWPLGRFAADAGGGRVKNPARLALEKVPFLLVTAVASLLTIRYNIVDPDAFDYVLPKRIDCAATSFFHYLKDTFWPVDLALKSIFFTAPQFGAGTLLALAGLVSISVAAYLLRKKAPYFLFAWGWWVFSILPVSGIVQVGIHLFADRFTYLPQMGFFLALAWGAGLLIGRFPGTKYPLVISAVILLALLAVMTRKQMSHWKDGITLMEHSMRVAPDDPFAAMLLGGAYGDKGRYSEAVDLLYGASKKVSLTHGGYFDLGQYAARTGRLDLAEFGYRRALEKDPEDYESNLYLGILLANMGEMPEAYGLLSKAATLAPQSADAAFNLGMAAEDLGRFGEARDLYRKTLELKSGHQGAFDGLRRLLGRR